ncbi:hypothetical protein D9M71_766390 [compost metagenome]
MLTASRKETKAEAAILVTEADETRGFRDFLLGTLGNLHLTDERTQADSFTQLIEERGRHRTGLLGAVLQDVFQI